MLEIRKLSTCNLQDAVEAWNEGFKEYFMDVSTNVFNFVSRLGAEGLSPEHSLVAFMDGRPVGIVLNGIRFAQGKKIAWNGGTAVAPNVRGRGIGRVLLNTTLEIYHDEGVELATLEAISGNEKAIKLYESLGYVKIDDLVFLKHTGPLKISFPGNSYSFLKGIPHDAAGLPFYKGLVPWQTQWASIKDGESLIILESNKPVGYILYKRFFDEREGLRAISLYQCELSENAKADVLTPALAEVFAPLAGFCVRMTSNLSSKSPVIPILRHIGFTPYAEQVLMTKTM